MKKPEGFADLGDFQEDDRIQIIGQYVLNHGKTVGVCIDDSPGKAERYIRKMKKEFPTVIFLDQTKGPVANVVTLRFGPQ
jgi:hypothetical protein